MKTPIQKLISIEEFKAYCLVRGWENEQDTTYFYKVKLKLDNRDFILFLATKNSTVDVYLDDETVVIHGRQYMEPLTQELLTLIESRELLHE